MDGANGVESNVCLGHFVREGRLPAGLAEMKRIKGDEAAASSPPSGELNPGGAGNQLRWQPPGE